jgi:hypothetical protein
VLAFARLQSGEHPPDAESFLHENSSGYFVLDPASVVWLSVPIEQHELPWNSGRTSPTGLPQELDLGIRLCAWYIDTTDEQLAQFDDVVATHQPQTPKHEN